jgi:hypothetical protein
MRNKTGYIGCYREFKIGINKTDEMYEGNHGNPKPKNQLLSSLNTMNVSERLTLKFIFVFICIVFAIMIIAPEGAEAWPTKFASCTSCHSSVDADASIYVAINGTETTSVSVDAGSSFEVDYYFDNATNFSDPFGVGLHVIIPDGWSLGPGTSNAPSLAGWNTAWDAAAGASWSPLFDTSGQYASTNGATIDFGGTSWDTGTGGREGKNAACDAGGSCGAEGGTDLDGIAETMGTDVTINVNPASTPGTYTVYVLGIGHEGGVRAHVIQSLSVTVDDPAGQVSRNPGTVADDASNGGSTAWGSTGDSAFQDDTYASSSNVQNETTNYLKATSFGFSIPAGATIDGIVVEVDRFADVASMVFDSEVKIVKGGAVGSTNEASGGFWPASDTDTYQTYGNSSYKWGETWTAADINNANFGVVISASSGGTKTNLFVDDIRITVYYTPAGNTAPDDPVSLAQYKTDGTTQITQGGTTDETSIIIKADVDDTDANNVSIEAEIVLNAGSFTGTANCAAGSSVSVPGTAQVTCSGLSDGNDYKWRVRAYDGSDYSNWVAYGGNPDVSINLGGNSTPNEPTGLTQYKSDAVTGITKGTYTDQSTVVMKATVSDPDSDNTKLEVEIVGVDSSFTGTPTCSSSFVTSGSEAEATCSGLANGVYKWQARSNDGSATSAWVGY